MRRFQLSGARRSESIPSDPVREPKSGRADRVVHLRIGALVPLLLALAAALLPGCIGKSVTPERPSIIVITIDTLRRDHVTVYGYERNTTPGIARFARDAVVFDEAFAAEAITAPSHASMLTGLYPPTHGIVRNSYPMAPGVRTLAQHLAELDYQTGAVVSGYTLKKDETELDRGFQHYDDDPDGKRFGRAELAFDRAVDWLDSISGDDRPLFMLYHMFDPHFPYIAPKPFSGMFLPPGESYRLKARGPEAQLRIGNGEPWEFAEFVSRYDDEIAYADHYFEKLMDELKKRGIWDDAMIIFVADHGETLDERFHAFDHGARTYEEQIRVPLIIRFPRGEFGGNRVSVPVHHVDLLPTVLSYLGLPVPDEVQGRSLMPVVRGEGAWDSERHTVSLGYPLAKRVPEVGAPLIKEGLVMALRAPPFKLITYPGVEGEIYQLFDLRTDPLEKNDISREKPALVEELLAELTAWRLEVGADSLAEAPELSPRTKEALRSLGYIH